MPSCSSRVIDCSQVARVDGRPGLPARLDFLHLAQPSRPARPRRLTHCNVACRGAQQTWESLIRGKDEEEEESGYPFPLVLKRKGGPGSVSGTTSGLTTPGGTVPNGRGESLSEHDLAQADQALSNHSTQ
ncbi:hypothetical protein NBRC10513_005799 [Rhodotorula toruloides]